MPKMMNLPNPKYPLPTRADRAAARADAKRRKAVVTEVVDDGEFMRVQWVRDNGEKVSAVFKLMSWGEAPREVTERFLEAQKHGPVQILYPTLVREDPPTGG